MSSNPQILAFAGSARKDSFNRKLLRVAVEIARQAGAEANVLDFRELPLPLFDQDLEAEQGLPENALKLKDLMRAHDGFLISAPEYNSSITPLLKNAIDWASRPVPNEKPLECFQGKTAGLLSASPGALGGLRGLVTVRSILSNIGVIVIPEQFALAKSHEALDADGALKDPAHRAAVERVVRRLIEVANKLRT